MHLGIAILLWVVIALLAARWIWLEFESHRASDVHRTDRLSAIFWGALVGVAFLNLLLTVFPWAS